MHFVKSFVLVTMVIASIVILGTSGVNAEMVAYDRDGNSLGVYAGNSGNNIMEIYVPSIDRAVHINISTGDLTGRDIYFESDDCFDSGTPYVVAEGTYKVILNGDQYYTGDDAAPQLVQVNSVFRSYNSQCEEFVSSRIVVPAHEVALPFALPAALPLNLELERRYKSNTH